MGHAPVLQNETRLVTRLVARLLGEHGEHELRRLLDTGEHEVRRLLDTVRRLLDMVRFFETVRLLEERLLVARLAIF